MLEISASDKGVLFPSIPLNSLYDSAAIAGNKPVDGLLIFNTTEKPSANLHKGLYAWNSVKRLWENIVSDQSFSNTLAMHYATEDTYFASNIQVRTGALNETQRINASSTPVPVQLSFDAGAINKDGCFRVKENEFVVPQNGVYRIICGMEADTKSIQENDRVEIYLTFSPISANIKATAHATGVRSKSIFSNIGSSLYVPLTPSLIYIGYLEKGVKVRVNALFSSRMNNTAFIYRKYLYVSLF